MIRWLKFWRAGKDGPDTAAALEDSTVRLEQAQKMAADAEPTVERAARVWRRNHIAEAAQAALHRYGSRT